MESLVIHHSPIIKFLVSFFSKFSVSDLVNSIGILVNAILAYWIVQNLQDKLNNKRFLKDHLINETIEIRKEFRDFLNHLYKGKLLPKEIVPWFKLMNIKCNDLLEIITKRHNVDTKILKPYTKDLKKLITEFNNFVDNYKNNDKLILDDDEKAELLKFQQKNNYIFNNLIMKINNHK